MKHAVTRPADSAGELFPSPHRSAGALARTHRAQAGARAAARPTAVTALYPITGPAPLAALGRLRKEAWDEIERLLAFLDATEVDADLEPSLGFPEVDLGRANPGHVGGTDNREVDDDYEDEGRSGQ